LEDTRKILGLNPLDEVIQLHIRTVATILAWIVVALLIINTSLRLEWIWLIAIALVVMAVIVYFFPQLRKWHTSKYKETEEEGEEEQKQFYFLAHRLE